MNINTYICAKLAVALLLLAMLWWGLHLAFLPPIYRIARPDALVEGYVLLGLSLVLLLFFRSAVHRLLWMAQEMHRIVSALLVMAALGVDGLMHAFSIPHMEGWWLPLLGSGALASAIAGWLQKFRARRDGD